MEEVTRAYVSVIKARDRIHRLAEQEISSVDLSEPQFNVLRILRGAGEPIPTSEVGRRMITRVPDITRLVDRLEKMGLVCRHRAPEGDRRKVLVEITTAGRERIAPLDRTLLNRIGLLFEDFSPAELRQLGELLERIGGPAS